jgi:hypothetical protein
MIISRAIKKKEHTLDTTGEHRVTPFGSFDEYAEALFLSDSDRFLSFAEYNLRCSCTHRPIEFIPKSRIAKIFNTKLQGNYFRLITEMTDAEYTLYQKKLAIKKERSHV